MLRIHNIHHVHVLDLLHLQVKPTYSQTVLVLCIAPHTDYIPSYVGRWKSALFPGPRVYHVKRSHDIPWYEYNIILYLGRVPVCEKGRWGNDEGI